ncbi:hypothetical protein YPPY47_2871 [Yersinia pestis PY-47]|nr:hypothetical protein YpUG050454_4173 [Yersinia pestis biovar Antiqua str. UG05-0454]EIS04031.1 hypothetical protein YPPY47_2871 [Yersinia pestis PY-47]EIS05224.1 hypothetical protein YPPY48_2823 [Yersinia pestis PY-48]
MTQNFIYTFIFQTAGGLALSLLIPSAGLSSTRPLQAAFLHVEIY